MGPGVYYMQVPGAVRVTAGGTKRDLREKNEGGGEIDFADVFRE